MTRRSLFAAALSPSAGCRFRAAPVVMLPLTVHPHGLYVEVRIHGSRPLNFQWDSAAGWHAINWSLAEELKLKLREHPSGAEGAGDNRTRAAEVLGASYSLGPVEFPFTPAAAIHLDTVSDRKGITLDGLLGAPLLKHSIVETDLGARTFRLYSAAEWRYTGNGQTLPVRVDGMGTPHLRVRFRIQNGALIEGEFKIDSAAGATALLFTTPFARKHGLIEAIRASGGKLLADEVGGVGGTSKLWHARLSEVRLGETRFGNPVVGITEARGGTLARADIAGIIGGGLLHRFKVIYDCPHSRIYLEPTARLEEPFEEDMAGVRWLNVGEGRRQFKIRAVLPDSPAAQAGLAPGDVLVSVDGRPAAAFDRGTLSGYLRREGRKVKLTALRKNSSIAAELTLTRMI